MDFALIGQHLLNGLMLGMIYALVAVGFTLFFGVLDVIKFSHGDVLMVGACPAKVVALTRVDHDLILDLVGAAGSCVDGGVYARSACCTRLPSCPSTVSGTSNGFCVTK